MHEFGLMQSVLNSVESSARDAGAAKICEIRLVIGEMREAVPEALDFAFEALSPQTLCENAMLKITTVAPRSRCLDCGEEFEHQRFKRNCPICDSFATELVAGKEFYIDAIEVEMPEEKDLVDANSATSARSGADTKGCEGKTNGVGTTDDASMGSAGAVATEQINGEAISGN